MALRKDRLLLMAERGRFIITLDSEEAWDGILFDWDKEHFILADPVHISAKDGDRVRADGQIWIPRSRIKYMQKA